METDQQTTKPFQPSDLAAWSIGFVCQRVQELGQIDALIVSYSDKGVIFEYTLNAIIDMEGERYAVIQRYTCIDLCRAYHDEYLDYFAERYIRDYRNAQARIG